MSAALLDAPRSEWTLPAAFAAEVAGRPDAVFVEVIGQGSATRRQVWEAGLQVAGGLGALGAQPGAAIAVMAATSLEAVTCWIAVGFAGMTEVPLNIAYRGASLVHALNLVGAEIALVDAALLHEVRAVEDELRHLKTVVVIGAPDAGGPAPSFSRIRTVAFDRLMSATPLAAPVAVSHADIATMIFTSGTSGPAKAVRMTHAQTAFLAAHTIARAGLTAEDRFYSAHPLFHMAGKFMAVAAMLLSGGTAVLDRRFEAGRWLDHVRASGATVSLAHGPMLEMIFAEPERPQDAENALRCIIAVPFPRGIRDAFEHRFRLRGLECWGMTEVNAVCWNEPGAAPRPGSCGRPDSRWFDFQVVAPDTDEVLPPGEIGEFVVRSKVPFILFQGYHGMDGKTLEAWRNLWFHTGDAGYMDADGYAYFVDRLGDRIRRRAENISSYEIEAAAAQHPAVTEAAAIGVPSGYEGDDDIKLFVALRAAASLSAPDFLAFLAARLPHYMVPRHLEVVDALPRTATNKIRKADLRRRSAGPDAFDRKAAGLSVRDLIGRP